MGKTCLDFLNPGRSPATVQHCFDAGKQRRDQHGYPIVSREGRYYDYPSLTRRKSYRRYLYLWQQGLCAYCGLPLEGKMELHHALDKDSRVVLLHAACHQRIEQRMLRAYTSMMVFARGRKNHPEVRGGQRRRTLVFAACGISVARNADGRRQRQRFMPHGTLEQCRHAKPRHRYALLLVEEQENGFRVVARSAQTGNPTRKAMRFGPEGIIADRARRADTRPNLQHGRLGERKL